MRLILSQLPNRLEINWAKSQVDTQAKDTQLKRKTLTVSIVNKTKEQKSDLCLVTRRLGGH